MFARAELDEHAGLGAGLGDAVGEPREGALLPETEPSNACGQLATAGMAKPGHGAVPLDKRDFALNHTGIVEEGCIEGPPERDLPLLDVVGGEVRGEAGLGRVDVTEIEGDIQNLYYRARPA